MAMFVSGSKYKELELQLWAARFALNAKVEEWNKLVNRINAKGGEAFLNSAPVPQFTADELKTLLQLCHPDKHGGKESAVRITQKLLELR